MSEPVKKETRQSSGGESEHGAQGGLTMSPPTFQLKAGAASAPNNGGGDGGGSGDLPEEYLAHLRLREGFRDHVYRDSRGFPTAGTGHLLSASERAQYPVGALVPRAVLDRWLAHDARGAYDAAVRQAGQLGVTSQAFINALGSVNFQLGTHWNNTFTHTWALMRAHNWEQAAQEVAHSAWARQTPVRVHDFQAALRALIHGTGNTGGGGGNHSGGNHSGGNNSGGHNTPPPATEHAIGTGTVTGDNVNVRSGPGTNYHTVGNQMDHGAHVSVYERRDGWLRIGRGRWMKAEFVHMNAAAPQPLTTGTITGDNVNVRSGPGTNHPTVGNQLDRGAHVSVFERRDGWLRIGTGRWVKGQYVHQANSGSGGSGGQHNTPTHNPPANGGNHNPPSNGGGQHNTPTHNPPANGGNSSTNHGVTISASVGAGGRNLSADVRKIQQLLKDLGYRMTVNGLPGKMLTGAIASFQEASGIGSDGKVDPGGNTLRRMNSTPNGSFHNTVAHTQEDHDAPRLTHSKWTNRGHFLVDTAGEAVPRQFYDNMRSLIRNMEIIADNLHGTFNVNCGYRSPYYNSTLEGSAAQSNHQFGRAVDIHASNYTPTQLREALRRLISEGKIHAGGIGIYSWGCHYDIDTRREWDGR